MRAVRVGATALVWVAVFSGVSAAPVAQARTVEMATGIAFEVPESFSISTLGGCDSQPTSMVSTSGGPLPLRSSGQVHLKDATGYTVSVGFLTANFSNLYRVDTTLTLCLPGEVELVEPFRIDITFFGALCVGAGCPGKNLPVNVIRVAPTAPTPPTSVSAAPSPGGVRVSWSPPSDTGGTPVTGYTATSSPGGLTCATTSTACFMSGLTKGTSYTFTVTATNVAGTSAPSAPSLPVTLTSVPGQVTDLRAVALKSALRLNWSAPADTGGLPVTRYEYRVGKQSWVATSSTTVTVRGLTSRRSIVVQVRAVNDVGAGAVVSVRATPKLT